MGGIFDSPKLPPPPAPPAPPPTIVEASQRQQQSDMLRRKRGRASTMLSGPTGTTASPTVATKTLLGQ
jgi:hypothetical protein